MEQHTQQNNDSVSRHVLHRIETGDISMRSKTHVVIRMILLVSLTMVIVFLSATLCSFIFFIVRQSGADSLLGFDHHELFIFVTLFPWGLLVADIVAIFCFELVLRQFSFGYRRSMLSLLLVSLGFTMLVAVVLDQSRTNDSILEHARNQHVPFLSDVHDGSRRPPAHELGVCRCVIQSIDGNTLVMYEDNPSDSTTVLGLLRPNFATSSLVFGRPVFIIGDFASGTIRVVDIRLIHSRF